MKNQKLDGNGFRFKKRNILEFMMRLFLIKLPSYKENVQIVQFLFELQHQIHHHNRNYNKELLDEILDNNEIDKKMFYEDKASAAVKTAYDRHKSLKGWM